MDCPSNNEFDRQRALALYCNAPGLTCEAIARKLNLDAIKVRRYLGYAPTKRNELLL